MIFFVASVDVEDKNVTNFSYSTIRFVRDFSLLYILQSFFPIHEVALMILEFFKRRDSRRQIFDFGV